jgi:glycosyltransferase involved in cell wall biosynthesis
MPTFQPPDMTVPVVLDVRVVAGTGGGPDKTILNAPRFLAPSGYHNICAYLHPPDDPGFEVLRERANALGAPLVSITDRGPLDTKVATELLAFCRRERVAIWHGHDYKSNLLGLMLRPFWPMRLVTTVHGWVHHTRRTPLYYAVDRFCLPFYERVVCVSEDLHHACRKMGVRESRCLLIENAIDTTQFARRTSRNDAKRRLGLDPEVFTIGAVGRLSDEKGFDLLIRAVDRLIRDGHNLALRIAGEGSHRERLEALLAELGQGDRIRLLGFQSDVLPLYEALDLFVLSSLREGLPNVVLEAMALEVPVVSTRIAGIPRVIEDGRNGLLVEPGAIDALAAAIARTINDPALRLQLAREGRATVELNHSFAVRMDMFRALYDELLKRQPEPIPARKVASA